MIPLNDMVTDPSGAAVKIPPKSADMFRAAKVVGPLSSGPHDISWIQCFSIVFNQPLNCISIAYPNLNCNLLYFYGKTYEMLCQKFAQLIKMAKTVIKK